MRSRRDAALVTGRLVLALLVASALAACGDDGTAAPPSPSVTRTVTVTAEPGAAPEPSGPASVTTSPSPTATATSAPPDGDVVEAEPSGSQVFLVDARVGAHEGYDRVVWEVVGDGTPGYRVGWTDDPRRDGSGEPVDLPGDATLQVVLVGVGIPPDAPAGTTPYDGPATLDGAGTTVVTEVEVGTVFEGYLTGFVGAEQERPFEVTLLSDPTRVVVDVSH